MQPEKNALHDDICEPEWVMLNHLLSYCAKSLPATDAVKGGKPGPSEPRCKRKNCLFGAKRH